MQLIVDASVVAKWFLPEAHKDKAETLLRDFLDEKIELTAPDLLVAEVGNLLWKRSVKLKDISSVQASLIYNNFLALGLPLRSTPAIASAALKLATEKNHPVYDMLYFALGGTRLRVRNGGRNLDKEIRKLVRLPILVGRPLAGRTALAQHVYRLHAALVVVAGSRRNPHAIGQTETCQRPDDDPLLE
jgi:predicted nucleic acid-binding protein